MDNLGDFQFSEESKTLSDLKALLNEKKWDTSIRFPHERDSV